MIKSKKNLIFPSKPFQTLFFFFLLNLLIDSTDSFPTVEIHFRLLLSHSTTEINFIAKHYTLLRKKNINLHII